MAAQGPMTWIDRALKKIADGTINLSSDTFHMVLLNSSQVISATFTGSSGDARYADLTGELATASGYTSGGVALSGVTLARGAANVTTWTSGSAQWTLTAGVTIKYAAIVDWTSANKDILGFCDFDTGGGTLTTSTGLLSMNPDSVNGWLYWTQ